MGKHANDSDDAHRDAKHREPKPRKPRRATVAGTGPATSDGPEPRLESIEPKTKPTGGQKLSERERWMLEQRPPHY